MAKVDVLPLEHEDFRDLYGGHRARILRLCRLMLTDADEAEEVAQEVFLKAFRFYRSGRRPDAWDKWLVTVAVNACRDKLRSSWWKRWRGGTEQFDEFKDTERVHHSAEDSASQRETQRLVWKVFGKLSARQREIFALRHFEGWSTEEVALHLGLSQGSVKQHLFRAVRELRKGIAKAL
jgi:RNA polymerase sigma-70 factor (ECF subfamily)